jgi:hypothetical protein
MKFTVSELVVGEKYLIGPNHGINNKNVIGVFQGDVLGGLAISFKVKPTLGIALYKGGIVFSKDSKLLFEKVAS